MEIRRQQCWNERKRKETILSPLRDRDGYASVSAPWQACSSLRPGPALASVRIARCQSHDVDQRPIGTDVIVYQRTFNVHPCNARSTRSRPRALRLNRDTRACTHYVQNSWCKTRLFIAGRMSSHWRKHASQLAGMHPGCGRDGYPLARRESLHGCVLASASASGKIFGRHLVPLIEQTSWKSMTLRAEATRRASAAALAESDGTRLDYARASATEELVSSICHI